MEIVRSPRNFADFIGSSLSLPNKGGGADGILNISPPIPPLGYRFIGSLSQPYNPILIILWIYYVSFVYLIFVLNILPPNIPLVGKSHITKPLLESPLQSSFQHWSGFRAFGNPGNNGSISSNTPNLTKDACWKVKVDRFLSYCMELTRTGFDSH